MSKPNPTKVSRSQQRIFDSAAKLFREKGFDAVSVEEILLDSTVARSTFYRSFTDKDDLLRQMLAPVFEHMSAQLEQLDKTEPENIINIVALSYISAWQEYGNALWLTANLGQKIFHLVSKEHDVYAMQIYQAMETLAEYKILRNDDAKLSAILLAQAGVKILSVYEKQPHFENMYIHTLRGMLLKW